MPAERPAAAAPPRPAARRVVRLLAALLLLAAPAPAESGASDPAAGTLVVAVREAPPCAMRGPGDEWEGLSVELWREVAAGIGADTEWRALDLERTLAALERGDVDVAIAALSVTAERARRFDYSHPYLASGLSLGVDADRSEGWLAAARAFLSLEFFTAVGALVVVLLVAAFAVWLFERRANPEQFGGGLVRGLGESFWWSAVTMTTVGYGDRAPVTRGGRIVALIWMFTSVIVIASFTASIAASVTVDRIASDLLSERRIAALRLAVLADSRAETYGRAKGLRLRAYASLPEAAASLRAGTVDAILHDAPILQHFALREVEASIEVLPGEVVRDDYAFGLAPGSALRKRVNVALLSVLHGPAWKEIRARHLGVGEED